MADATDDGRCPVGTVLAGRLEAAVWQDVCEILRHPHKIEEEYQRRLHDPPGQGKQRGVEPLTRVIEKVKRSIARLIDLYSEGLLDRAELDPRLQSARQRLSKLEEDAQRETDELAQQAELRLALTCLQDFAAQVQQGLDQTDWVTQREIIRALVKRVEIGAEEVRIVYRVAPVPFVERPYGGVLQHCPNRFHRLPPFSTISTISRDELPEVATQCRSVTRGSIDCTAPDARTHHNPPSECSVG